MAIYTITSQNPIQIIHNKPRAVSYTVFNRDPAVSLTVGLETQDHQVPDFTNPLQTNVVDPLASVTFDGTQNVFAVTQPDNQGNPTAITVEVYPSTTSQATSPAAIADTLVSSGLALQIAQAIASQGISIFGGPQALYGGNQPRTGAGRVGTSCDKWTYVPNGSSDLSLYSEFDGFVGRPFNTVSRRYYGEGGTPQNAGQDGQNIAGFAAAGFKCCLTYKPFRDKTNNYSGTIPGQGGLTYAQHLANLKTSIAYVQSAATQGIECCLWHEMNGNGPTGPFGSGGPYGTVTAAQAEANYAAYVAFYGPAFKQATNGALTGDMPLVYVPAAYSPANMVAFFPTPNVYHTGIAVDYYGQDFNSKPTTVPQGVSDLEALADSLTMPFGAWEIGWYNGPTRPSTATLSTWINQEITARWLARLDAGKPNADIIWFASPSSGPGPSPNAPSSATDPTLIAGMQAMFDQLSDTPTNLVSIPGGGTLSLAPLNPSPGAGYAIADGISYDITVNATAGASSTNPFLTVRMQWFNVDASSAQSVATQYFYLPQGTNGTVGTVTTGIGPQHGQFLQVVVFNHDTVTTTISVQVNSTSRAAGRHDWLWDVVNATSVPTFTLAGGAAFGNSLGSMSSVSVPANGSVVRLFGMRPGQAYFRANGAGTNVLTATLAPVPSSAWGTSGLINESLNGEFETLFVAPRCPMQLTVANSDASAHNVNIEIISRD